MKSIVISRTLQALAPRARIARVLAAVAFAGLLAACSGSTDVGVTSTVTISPTTVTLAPGGTQQFTAVVKNSAGDVLAVTPTWSLVAGGGTITSTGLFTAGTTAGTFTVAVTCSGITATATVIVSPGALLTITVTPNPATLAIGATQQFTAVGKDANGNIVAITPVWSTVNPPGSINAGTGLFTAGNTTGTFPNTVRATQGTIFGTATVIVVAGPLFTITVTPNPDTLAVNTTQQFTAVGKDAGGNVVPIPPPLVWSVVNGGGSIVANTGLFTAGAVTGTFTNTIKATSGAISGFATVVVIPTPAAPLATASPFGILAGSTITCVTGGIINADIGLSPGSAVTLGSPACVVTGTQHITDGVAAQAQLDLTQAYNALAGLPCPAANNIGTTNIGGTTKAAGVYCSASSIQVSGTLTLDGGGDPNATFVFQAGSTLSNAPPPGNIVLIGGAQAKNVWWQVGASATIGTGSQWKGNILALSSITLNDNVTLIGRALARNGAVTLGTGDTITLP